MVHSVIVVVPTVSELLVNEGLTPFFFCAYLFLSIFTDAKV